jgi:hypothetical protein
MINAGLQLLTYSNAWKEYLLIINLHFDSGKRSVHLGILEYKQQLFYIELNISNHLNFIMLHFTF